jgi:lipoprotein-anchoring transpeptidase ErfK/SrfK
VFASDPKKQGVLIPVKAFLCSTGKATPNGTFKTSSTYRWHPLIHNVYGQWCTRITGSILFHSVYYSKNTDANSLDVVEFNKLGTAASAGCVRLNCADTKWIYDNCKTKTEVVIYEDADPGPLGVPEQILLDTDHTWDPTDPEMQTLCQQNGCHQE